MQVKYPLKIGLAICTPIPLVRKNERDVLDTISHKWHKARTSLLIPTNYSTMEIAMPGMEVGDARTGVGKLIRDMEKKPEFLFFLDYDVLPDFDAVRKLLQWAVLRPEYDVYAGVYCSKSQYPEPLIYAGNGGGPYWNWALGDVLTTDQHGISGVHMGLTLIRCNVFSRMTCTDDKPYFRSTNSRGIKPNNSGAWSCVGTEDLYFCARLLNELNGKILVDTSVLAGHEDKETGIIYGLPAQMPPIQKAKFFNNEDQKLADKQGLKIALDLGAGGLDRKWNGYVTYTTDIRSGVGDYCQDTVCLNFPDDHFDLVASSHHLEHIGRWDQERAWAGIFRITKPGGSIHMIVPSIEWAARKISDGEMDEHVMNVLYGAQEAHDYERIHNTHFFGYTKALFRTLAESVGFVNVVVTDWKDDPDLGYNLVLIADKPQGKTKTDEEKVRGVLGDTFGFGEDGAEKTTPPASKEGDDGLEAGGWCVFPNGDQMMVRPLVDLATWNLGQLPKVMAAMSRCKRVLELGPCHGLHTRALLSNFDEVVAVEGREENAKYILNDLPKGDRDRVKMIVEDVDGYDMQNLGEFDLVWNTGVLYHLRTPAVVMKRLSALAPVQYLCTHFAGESDGEVVSVDGYKGIYYVEMGHRFVAGIHSDSFWLLESSLVQLFSDCGYKKVTKLGEQHIGTVDAGISMKRGQWILEK